MPDSPFVAWHMTITDDEQPRIRDERGEGTGCTRPSVAKFKTFDTSRAKNVRNSGVERLHQPPTSVLAQ